jgi:hypothetical protein
VTCGTSDLVAVDRREVVALCVVADLRRRAGTPRDISMA